MITGRFRQLTVAGVVLSFLAACAAPKVTQEVEMPAREFGMVSAKKLAVFNIDGDRDGTFTAKVESYLANIKVRGKPYFEIVERKMLDTILAEQRMVSGSGLFNEKDAVKLGNLAGADTLITGGVRIPPVAARNYQKTEQVCRAYKEKGGKQTNECAYWGTVYRPCVERRANADFTLKAVSVQKGSIIFTKTYSGRAGDNHCGGSSGKSAVDLQNEALRQVLGNLRMDVAPYRVTVSIEFMDSDDVMSSATKSKVSAALEYVEQKRIDRACELFKEASAGDTNSPALYYNMGVCAEISSDLDRAESLFNQADRKTSKPVPLISAAINRVKRMKSDQQAVNRQIR